jgi:hypothetical protein
MKFKLNDVVKKSEHSSMLYIIIANKNHPKYTQSAPIGKIYRELESDMDYAIAQVTKVESECFLSSAGEVLETEIISANLSYEEAVEIVLN